VETLFPESGITLCVDFNSLTTYLALGETRRLFDDMQIEVNWLPLVRTPGTFSIPASDGDPLAGYKARRARARTMFAERELQRNCERLGISTRQGGITFDPVNASHGLLWLRQVRADAETYWQYADAVFSSAFREQDPMQDVRAIRDLLARLHLPNASSSGHEFEDFVTTGGLGGIQDALLDAGIFNSPAYIYEGERFMGRQHLPLLRWILGGRKGSAPV
jgi:2-hydroxychromene-2-carboxylate isomerase